MVPLFCLDNNLDLPRMYTILSNVTELRTMPFLQVVLRSMRARWSGTVQNWVRDCDVIDVYVIAKIGVTPGWSG